MDDILATANQSQAKNKVIILDCCHSGQMGEPKFSVTAIPCSRKVFPS